MVKVNISADDILKYFFHFPRKYRLYLSILTPWLLIMLIALDKMHFLQSKSIDIFIIFPQKTNVVGAD